MRPFMTHFCVVYSLEFGVVSLCAISILISGGLICNHQLKIPNQIRDWRNGSVYSNDQLHTLYLNVQIGTWVLVGDIFSTLLMILPVALTDIRTPWKERNCRRKILIPCIIGKVLCIMHGIAGFVWITWKFHYDCPEIIGILIALALYVLLGFYVIVVAISYYIQLGMRMTFHKLKHSASGSTEHSQESQAKQQKAALGSDSEMGSRSGRIGSRRQDNIGIDVNREAEFKDEEAYKGSKRKLQEHDEDDARKPYRNPEKRSHSSQEILNDKSSRSKERLQRSEAEEREEQYKRLLNRSRGSQDHLDEHSEQERKAKNVRQMGPDQMEYRVSEREEIDGGGKRRYYYRRDKRDPYERPAEEETNFAERQRMSKPRRSRQASDNSLGSMGRLRSPPRHTHPRNQSDSSYGSNDGIRNHPYRQNEQNFDQFDRDPRQVASPGQEYDRDSDDSLGQERPPPVYQPPVRLAERHHDKFDRGRPEVHRVEEPQYHDPPRKYFDEEPVRQHETAHRDDYDNHPSRGRNMKKNSAYRGANEIDDKQYPDDEYEQAFPYEGPRYDQDGYISSEV